MQSYPVPAFELDPAMPSGALPIFGEYLDRVGRGATQQQLAACGFVLLGATQFFTRTGVALPVGMIALFGFFAAVWTRFARGVPATRLKREPFRRVDIAEDGLVVAGRVVGVRLPDGRWLRVRLTESFRLLLARHRRIWLLGTGPKVFAGFAGSVRLRGARVHDRPPSGAVPVPPPTWQSGSPRLDPVLGAHRRSIARGMVRGAAFLLGLAALATWIRLDYPANEAARTLVVAVFTGIAVLAALAAVGAVLGALRYRRPLAADHWTELRAVPDGPVRLRGHRAAQLSGLTMLADGRVVRFRLWDADPSMAANIAATGRLWIAGAPRPGAVRAGVPGYPVLGTVHLG